jgi:transposase
VVILSHIPFPLPGFEIQDVTRVDSTLIIAAVATRQAALCPSCGKASSRIHSYYLRKPRDLSSYGCSVQLHLHVRRFRCQNTQCLRQTFSERLPEVVAVSAQRTVRLTTLLSVFAVALSGQLASCLLGSLGVKTSADTLLRLVKQDALPETEVPKAVGVDDFALRRGKTYGTMVVDLSTRRPIALLSGRTAQTLSRWLEAHPGVAYISRDRSSEYMRGADEGAPQAQQILDRWHLFKNVREVVQRIVSRAHATLTQRQKDSGMTIRARSRRKRSSSEIAASQVARLRRQAWYEEVVELYRQGESIAAIARELHMSPITVRKFVYAGAFPERSAHKRRQSYLLTPYLPYLQQRVAQGCENASELWKEICQLGFTQGYKVVNSWLREDLGKSGRPSTEEEKAKHQSFMEKVAAEPGLVPASSESVLEASVPLLTGKVVEPVGSPRHLTWLLLRDPSSLNAQEQSTLTFIRETHDINVTYGLAQRFFTMVRERQADQLDDWLEACEKSGIPDLQTFSEGLRREYSALKGALTFSYSNGPVEGQINKLKYIKRSMYGRGSFEVLRQKVLRAG